MTHSLRLLIHWWCTDNFNKRNIRAGKKKIDLYTYKLVGIIKSEDKSFASLINADGEVIALAMFEELNDGVKLVDMKQMRQFFKLKTLSYNEF